VRYVHRTRYVSCGLIAIYPQSEHLGKHGTRGNDRVVTIEPIPFSNDGAGLIYFPIRGYMSEYDLKHFEHS